MTKLLGGAQSGDKDDSVSDKCQGFVIPLNEW